MAEFETLNENQKGKWGGARNGAGRKAHSKNPQTIVREEVLRQFKDRVAKHTDRIFNAQLDLAIGEKYLLVKRVSGKGKDRKTWVEVVEDVETIKQYLDDDGETLNADAGEEFYYMTTKPANNMALDSLLNRAYGKAQEKMDITTDGEKIETAILPEQAMTKFTEFLSQNTKQ